ncbi:hypothetical protein AcW1_005953 [Taiwanofungus camphoratus]|nr:hypothetical protein AcW2_004706 [Antrodia cinnamomea]KAI0934426.1 hypothetical protein AcV5_006270 [Antrodia cinnamomea]KAI0950287.1 hypothetical protein AcV7_008803 [Antrodia cinnamomea]KAI0957621.1 hypothetical protein AcW1_005953 [Antrodia cinnamomea]
MQRSFTLDPSKGTADSSTRIVEYDNGQELGCAATSERTYTTIRQVPGFDTPSLARIIYTLSIFKTLPQFIALFPKKWYFDREAFLNVSDVLTETCIISLVEARGVVISLWSFCGYCRQAHRPRNSQE